MRSTTRLVQLILISMLALATDAIPKAATLKEHCEKLDYYDCDQSVNYYYVLLDFWFRDCWDSSKERVWRTKYAECLQEAENTAKRYWLISPNINIKVFSSVCLKKNQNGICQRLFP